LEETRKKERLKLTKDQLFISDRAFLPDLQEGDYRILTSPKAYFLLLKTSNGLESHPLITTELLLPQISIIMDLEVKKKIQEERELQLIPFRKINCLF